MQNQSTTTNCPFCGEQISANAIKCKYCGEWLNVKCPHCHEHISINSKVCPACYSKLNFNKTDENYTLAIISWVLTGLYMLIILAFVLCYNTPDGIANITNEDKAGNIFAIICLLLFPLLPAICSLCFHQAEKASLASGMTSLLFATIGTILTLV